MNRFLIYLLEKLNEEKDLVEEYIFIDNKLMSSSTNIEALLNLIKSNINEKKLISDLILEEKHHILTEGSPELVLKILNDFPYQVNKLFVNHEFVAINRWLVKKCMDFYKSEIELDISYNYYEYLQLNEPILIIGEKEFTMAKLDFKNNVITYSINKGATI